MDASNEASNGGQLAIIGLKSGYLTLDSTENKEEDPEKHNSQVTKSQICMPMTRSAKALKDVTMATRCYTHDRVRTAVYCSQSGEDKANLNLSARHIGSKSFLPIAACLQAKPMISCVDISYNSLDEEGGIYVALSLIMNNHVTVLNLAGNKFGGTKAPAYLAVLLAENNVLQTVDLSDNNFCDKDAHIISGGIMENDNMKVLNLSTNYISDIGAGYIGRAFHINSTLEAIDLSSNCIRETGGVFVGKSLMTNHFMTEVNISANGIGYSGALAIRECLARNSTLKTLDISNNRINWEGALALAHGLEMNRSLESFSAGLNPLTTTGCMDIIDALSNNCTLKLLKLQYVNVVKEFKQAIRFIQEKNPEFTAIYGCVVANHDVLGLRKVREIHPMSHLTRYLIDKELRPIELLRIMDKTVSFSLTVKEFMTRCDMLGIHIETSKRQQFLDFIMAGSTTDNISYVVLLEAITKYLTQERDLRITERRKLTALTKYQRYLLDRKLPRDSSSMIIDALTDNLTAELKEFGKEEVVCSRLKKYVKQTQLAVLKLHGVS